MGFGKSLANITDDPRVNLPASEILRIREDLDYYADVFDNIKFFNTLNQQQSRKPSTLSITHQAARKLASVIFNEQVTVSVTGENIDTFINSVLTDNLFNLKYEEYLETGIARGELKETVVVGTPIGVEEVKKEADLKTRISALKEIMKRYPGNDKLVEQRIRKLSAEADIAEANAREVTDNGTANEIRVIGFDRRSEEDERS